MLTYQKINHNNIENYLDKQFQLKLPLDKKNNMNKNKDKYLALVFGQENNKNKCKDKFCLKIKHFFFDENPFDFPDQLQAVRLHPSLQQEVKFVVVQQQFAKKRLKKVDKKLFQRFDNFVEYLHRQGVLNREGLGEGGLRQFGNVEFGVDAEL